MSCPVCNHEMISWKAVEREELGATLVVKTISSRECPACGVEIRITIPTTFEDKRIA